MALEVKGLPCKHEDLNWINPHEKVNCGGEYCSLQQMDPLCLFPDRGSIQGAELCTPIDTVQEQNKKVDDT